MAYLTYQNNETFKENYTKNFAPVDPISHAFGIASHSKFYFEMTGWCQFIDVVIPDAWYCKWVQDFLITIVKFCYENRAEHTYNTGVDMGRSIVGKVNEVIDDYTKKVNDAINRLNTLRSDAEKWLRDHEKRLKELEKQTGLPVKMFPELLKW